MPGVNVNATMTPSATKQRRANKPLMERRRRERINQCLNELKSLVLKAQKKDPSRFTKLEKADILEMTVRHVKSLHGTDLTASQERYEQGFSRCTTEVSSFLQGFKGLPPDLISRVTSHLNNAVPKLTSHQEGKGAMSSQEVICPITRVKESVPLASLENHNGCFTISKNVTEPFERTVSPRFLETSSPNQGFILTVQNSASNSETRQWCPPFQGPFLHPPSPQSSSSKARTYLPSADFEKIQNWRISCSSSDGRCKSQVLGEISTSASSQEAPLNLVTSQRNRSQERNQPSYLTFPPSPPSSSSPSPEPSTERLQTPECCSPPVERRHSPAFERSTQGTTDRGSKSPQGNILLKTRYQISRPVSFQSLNGLHSQPQHNQQQSAEASQNCLDLHWRPWSPLI